MALHISIDEANAWSDKTKLNLGQVDTELEASEVAQVLARVSSAYDTSSWSDNTTTPILIRKIIAMRYMGWYYQRTYSEDDQVSTYGIMLIREADKMLEGIEGGAILLPDATSTFLSPGTPSFYPTTASSAAEATWDDMSLGDAKFSMGTIW